MIHIIKNRKKQEDRAAQNAALSKIYIDQKPERTGSFRKKRQQ